MITALINGGLASQLNKYIIAYQLSQYLNTDLCLNLSDFYNGYFRPYFLSYFDLPDCYYAKGVEYNKISNKSFCIQNAKDMFFLYRHKDKFNYNIIVEDVNYKDFLINYPEFDVSINSSIIKCLKLKHQSNFVEQFSSQIKGKDSIAVHFRRGDFVSLGWNDDVDYYKSSIGYMLKKNPNAEFYFFSNDLPWVYKNFGNNERFHYVMSIDGYYGDVEEFLCMSKCKYRILSIQSGFGKLSNIISCSNYGGKYSLFKYNSKVKGFDLLNKSIDYNERYNNEYYRFLTEEELNVGLDFYNLNINSSYTNRIDTEEMCCINSNNDLDRFLLNIHSINSDSIIDLYNKRIDLSIKEDDSDRIKDCLETLVCIDPISIEKYNDLWQNRYYFVSKEVITNYANSIVELDVPKEIWFINGILRFIMILNRLGSKIVLTSRKNSYEYELKNIDNFNLNIRFIGGLIPNICIKNNYLFNNVIIRYAYRIFILLLDILKRSLFVFFIIRNNNRNTVAENKINNINSSFYIMDYLDSLSYQESKDIIK